MGKYYLRYLLLLLPALLVSVLCNQIPATARFLAEYPALSASAQWFCVLFIMLFGFGVNTAAATYRFPRATLSFILLYTGVNLLIITALYVTAYGTTLHWLLRNVLGATSYIPLRVIVQALIDFNIKQEAYATLAVTACCTLGYIAGLVRRHISPNPYRPRIG